MQPHPRGGVFITVHHPVPARTDPLGSDLCGEAGCAGAAVSVMNTVIDPLSPYGIRPLDVAATPYGVWPAIRRARSAPAS